MKKLSLLAMLFALSACKSGKLEGEAIHATVVLDPGVQASCIHVEVRDPATHAAAAQDWVPRRGKNELQVAIFRKSLPKDVEIAAQPYQDGDCENDTVARTANGAFVTVTASFVEGQVVPATLPKMLPGKDADGDGYVSTTEGGADCQDSVRGVNPGVQEQCTDQQDLNCDNKAGCAASACGGTACFQPPANLALTVPSSVVAGICTQGKVDVKDSSGGGSRVSTATSVGLASNPNGGIAFYSDSDCKTPASSTTIAAQEGTAGFYFQGQTVGTVSVSASASGLPTAAQNVQITPGTGNRLVFVSLGQTVTAGLCSAAVQVQSQDAQGNPAAAASATTISLAATPSTSFQFFTAAGCTAGSEVTSVNLPAGANTAAFYFKGTKAGGVSVTATAPGFTGNSQAETIKPAAAKTVILAGPSTATAGDCGAVTQVDVTLQDSFNNPTTVTANTNINLSASGKPLTFSPTSGCGSTSASVTINSGLGTVSFFFKGTQAGGSTITAASAGLTSGTLGVTINAAAPTSHVFTTSGQTVPVGTCSGPVTVQMQDPYTNPAKVSSDTTVGLTANPPEGFQFFAGTSCSGSAVTQVSVLTGQSDVSFSFKSTKATTVTVTASVGATNKTQSELINPGAPALLALTPTPLTMVAGDCKQVTVQSQDSFTNASPVTGSQTVTLSAGSATNFVFHSNSGCTSPTTSVNIPGGQSNATFWVKGTTAGSVTVTASHAPWTDGTLPVTVSAAVPSKIVFKTGAQRVVMGSCSGITTLEVQDTYNNPSAIGSIRTINLSSTASNLTFYTDSMCMTPAVTAVTVAANQTSTDFYFKGSAAAASVTLTASDGTLPNVTQVETIDPLPPDALAFTTPERSNTAGLCTGPVTVQARVNGNPTTVTSPLSITPSATGFTFFSDGACNNSASTVTINTGASTTDFYFKGSTAGTFVLTAHSGTLTDATQNATITAAAPTKLAWATSPLTTVAGVCSLVVTIQSQDPFNNPSPVATNKNLSLNQTGTPADSNFKFYSDSNCTTDTGTSVTLQGGQSSVNFYYRGEKARTVTFAISGGGLTGTPFQNHTIVPASVARLAFSSTTPPQTMLAGTCALRTVERQDAFGNTQTDTGDLAVTLSGSTTAEFFQDASCTNALPPLSILSGNSSASFYFKGYTGGDNTGAPLVLTASSSGLTSGTQTETINPTIRTGSCTLSGTTINCPIALPVSDTTKAFLVFRAISGNSTSTQANVRCRLNTVSQIVCDRSNSGGSNVTVNWSLAEFPTNVTVEHLAPACSGDTSQVAVTNAPLSESFLLLSSERDVTNQGSSVLRLAELKSATQAEIRKTTGGCTVTDVNDLQAVRFVGASVQRGLVSMGSGSTNVTATLSPSVVTSRSLLLYSYRIADTGTKICDRALRGELTNGTTVTFSRGEGDTTNCAGMAIPEISWEVIQFPAGTVVQQVTQQLSGVSTLATVSTVDQSRTMVFAGGQWASGQLHGEGRYSSSELIGEMRAQSLWVDSTTLQLSRNTANSTATFTAFVVQFKP